MSAQGDSFSFLLYKYLELLFIFQICFTFNDNKTEIQTESEYNKVKTFNVFYLPVTIRYVELHVTILTIST
jgi:hypothetical protein